MAPTGTRRHAQLALQARVVVDRLVVGGRLGVDQDRAQQDEVAELRVDDVAVDAHVPRPAATATGLCETTQILPGKRSISIGKPIAGFTARTPCVFQGRHDLAGDLVDVIAGVVEFQVGDRAGRAADRLPVHPADEAEERLGRREGTQDVVPLVVQGRAADLDQAGVVGPAVQAQLTQPRRIEGLRRLGGAGRSPWLSWKRRTVGCSARFMTASFVCICKYRLQIKVSHACPSDGGPYPTLRSRSFPSVVVTCCWAVFHAGIGSLHEPLSASVNWNGWLHRPSSACNRFEPAPCLHPFDVSAVVWTRSSCRCSQTSVGRATPILRHD